MRELQISEDEIRFEMLRSMRQQVTRFAQEQEVTMAEAMHADGADMAKAKFTWLLTASNGSDGAGRIEVQVVPWLAGKPWPTRTAVHDRCFLLAGFDRHRAVGGLLYDASALVAPKRLKAEGFKS
jgi:hypothetical protein